jgi:hypothetical protein
VVPPSAPRSLRRGFWIFAALFAALSAPVVGDIWAASCNPRAIAAMRAAAVLAGAIAAICWADAHRYDRDARALIRQNDDLYDRIPEDDRPPLLRSAR